MPLYEHVLIARQDFDVSADGMNKTLTLDPPESPEPLPSQDPRIPSDEHAEARISSPIAPASPWSSPLARGK